MATRGTIWIIDEDVFKGVYVHFDAYPDHLKITLDKFYNTKDKALELINSGGISYLDESYENSIFYARDRDEDLSIYIASKYDDMEQYFQEYNYIFTGNSWDQISSLVIREAMDSYTRISNIENAINELKELDKEIGKYPRVSKTLLERKKALEKYLKSV